MSDPTPAPRRMKRRLSLRLIVALTLLALLIVFEAGIRVIQPDTLTYTASVPAGWPAYQYEHTVITNPRAVAGWYDAVNAHPLPSSQTNFLSPIFVHCNGLYSGDESYRFEFTWHGHPVETASTTETNRGPILWPTSGAEGCPACEGMRCPLRCQRRLPDTTA